MSDQLLISRNQMWIAALLAGVIAVSIGATLLFWPSITITELAILCGLYLLAAGVTQLLYLIIAAGSPASKIAFCLSGVAALLFALILLGICRAVLWVGFFTAVGMISRGIAQITTAAIDNPRIPGREWRLARSAVMFPAGVVIFVPAAWPLHSIAWLGIAAGGSIAITGVVQLATALAMRGERELIAVENTNT